MPAIEFYKKICSEVLMTRFYFWFNKIQVNVICIIIKYAIQHLLIANLIVLAWDSYIEPSSLYYYINNNGVMFYWMSPLNVK